MLNSINIAPEVGSGAQKKPRKPVDKNLMRDIIQILTMPIKNNRNERLLIIATLDMLKFIVI